MAGPVEFGKPVTITFERANLTGLADVLAEVERQISSGLHSGTVIDPATSQAVRWKVED